MDKKIKQTVIINRAVSGSGKTTISKCLMNYLKESGINAGIYSTDDLFTQNGRYVFDLAKLWENHLVTLSEFSYDLQAGRSVVICDNMNLLPWQSQPYTDAARNYGYQILFINYLTRGLDKHLAAQVVTPDKPDAHGLSEELLVRFIDDFNNYSDLLDKNNPIDPERHYAYIWNNELLRRDRVETPVNHFDADYVITMQPDEYHEMKQKIGPMILELIK